MSPRLLDRVVRLALAFLVGALAVAGVGTGVLLHLRARASLDEALLAAAYGEAHPWTEVRWGNDHISSPVALRVWREGDPDVPDELALLALHDERPRYVDVDAERMLLLVVEPPPGTVDADDPDHPHQLLVVTADRVTWTASAGPFALAWLLVTGVTGALAGTGLRAGLRRALAPLAQAADDLAALPGLGAGVRLQGGGVHEVDVVLASVNALLERLEHAFAVQGRFVADAAHELRTPVAVLRGELELALRRERDAPAYREALQRLEVEAHRLSDRVEALMALARVDAGQAEAGREREHVSALVHRAVHDEQVALRDAGLHLTVTLEADPEVPAHGALVSLAIGNLLRNAAQHARARQVRVTTRAAPGAVEILVDDDGAGLPPERREALARRFSRGTGSGGLGLGLTLAREVARRHGGDLVLEASPQGGLRARLVLAAPDSHHPAMSA